MISLNHLRPGMDGRVVSTQIAAGRLKGISPGSVVHCCCRSPGGRETVLLVRGRYLWVQTRDLERIHVVCL